MRRHWFDPVERRWMFREVPNTDEAALRLLRGSPDAETCLKVFGDWRGLGAGVEAALMRVSAHARETEEEEAGPRGPPGSCRGGRIAPDADVVGDH